MLDNLVFTLEVLPENENRVGSSNNEVVGKLERVKEKILLPTKRPPVSYNVVSLYKKVVVVVKDIALQHRVVKGVRVDTIADEVEE